MFFISPAKTAECVAVAAIFSIFFCVTLLRVAGILQNLGYSPKKLFLWAGKKNNPALLRQSLLTMLCALSSAVLSLAFWFAGEWAAVAGAAAFVIFFALYAVADKKAEKRTHASFTPRFTRLYALLFFIVAVLAYLCVCLLNFASEVWKNDVFTLFRYVPLAIFPLLSLPLTALACVISFVVEAPLNNSYVRKAEKKLSASKLKVIAVTGSYGKTSVKNILSTVLSQKFSVLSTPRSYNTPAGIALTLNGSDLEKYDIFIAEMGARNVGDISELCKICPPNISVLTGICPQHLETFKTLENIVEEKGKAIAAASDLAVIAPDAFEYYKDCEAKKVEADCVRDIVCGTDGTAFTLFHGGEERRVKIKLLGGHSATNCALAAEVAFALGMSLDEVCSGLEKCEFIAHRLELMQSEGVYVLDDGYNSNVVGARSALAALRLFGGSKICVTPGLVELGVLEESENYALGGELVGLDCVILVGETLITPVKEGYLDGGGDPQKLLTAPDLKAAEELLRGVLQKGDCVLFLNDLPDIYV